MVHLSLSYMTVGKTITLTAWIFVGKVVSPLFNNTVWVCHSFSSKEQASFNFMVTVTDRSDFGAQENTMSLLPLFPHLFARSDGTRCHDIRFLNVEFQASFFTLFFHTHQEAL